MVSRHTILFLLVIMNSFLFAQSTTICDNWSGILSVQGHHVKLVFKISKDHETLKASMDSPDQKAFDIPLDITYDGLQLRLSYNNNYIEYFGTYQTDSISGVFKQSGLTIPLNLFRDSITTKQRRPQTPAEPYPYHSEEVAFKNEKDGITLSGTLTTPLNVKSFPVVVLISGSGPQNRNEEIFGHQPFLVIADYLTRNGIGVLRYDDRGVNKSTGNFTTSDTRNFASDLHYALKYLSKVKKYKTIGLIGHSEGGIIAPMMQDDDTPIAFMILLAAPALKGSDLLLLQQRKMLEVQNSTNEEITKLQKTNQSLFEFTIKNKELPEKEFDLRLRQLIQSDSSIYVPENYSKEAFSDLVCQQLNNPWMKFYLGYDPAPKLKTLKCPILALNGSKDLQVPSKENLSLIQVTLDSGKNKNHQTVELENLNHLFQESETGSPSEYETIDQTFSPKALELICNWIHSLSGKKNN